MDIDVLLEKIVREIYRIRFAGGHWNRYRWIRKGLQEVWEKSDLFAGELCDVLECSMEELEYALDEDLNPKARQSKKCCWEENLSADLPLFISVKIRGI